MPFLYFGSGAGLFEIGPQLLVLFLWMVLCFAVALGIFKWR